MASESSSEDEQVVANGDMNDHTDAASVRVWWLSTAATLLVLLTYSILMLSVAFGVAKMPGGNAWGMFGVAFVLFVLYVVGPGTVEAYKKLKGK